MLGTGLTSAWSRRPGEGLCSSFAQCCTSQAAPALVASSSTCCCSGAGKPATPPSLAGMALHSPSAGVFWEEKGNNIILFCAEMLFVCCKRNLKAGALRPPPQGTLQQQPMPPAPVFCRAESGLRGFPVSPQRNAGAGHGTDTRTDIGMDIGMSASTSLALATAKCVPWAGQIPPRWQQPICRAHAAGRVGGRRAEITV